MIERDPERDGERESSGAGECRHCRGVEGDAADIGCRRDGFKRKPQVR